MSVHRRTARQSLFDTRRRLVTGTEKGKNSLKRNENFLSLSFTLLHFSYIGFLDRIGPNRLLVYPHGRGSRRLRISRRNALRLTWILGGVDRRLRQHRRRYLVRHSTICAGRERASNHKVVSENFQERSPRHGRRYSMLHGDENASRKMRAFCLFGFDTQIRSSATRRQRMFIDRVCTRKVRLYAPTNGSIRNSFVESLVGLSGHRHPPARPISDAIRSRNFLSLDGRPTQGASW